MQRLRRAHRLRREVRRLVLAPALQLVQGLAPEQRLVQAPAMALQLVQQLLVSARVHRCNRARLRA
ncbi:MAG: hypothetical protein RL643_77 [Actinomycetota bacterium]